MVPSLQLQLRLRDMGAGPAALGATGFPVTLLPRKRWVGRVCVALCSVLLAGGLRHSAAWRLRKRALSEHFLYTRSLSPEAGREGGVRGGETPGQPGGSRAGKAVF